MKRIATTRNDWKLEEMPKSHSTIPVSRDFSEQEMEKIKLGSSPDSMDDHWFIFFEKNRLYIHRSWTGYCIYVVSFEHNQRDQVACEIRVNRNPKQYRTTDDDYDVKMAFWVIDCILLGQMDSQMPESSG